MTPYVNVKNEAAGEAWQLPPGAFPAGRAGPPQSLQVNGAGTVSLAGGLAGGTAKVTVNARSIGEPELAWETDPIFGDDHPYLSAPAKGSVTIKVDTPTSGFNFTAKVIRLRTVWLDVVRVGTLEVHFDSSDLPAGFDPTMNKVQIGDGDTGGGLENVFLPFLEQPSLLVEKGDFRVRGWTWPEPWLPLP